jgi:hypothetical protein
MVCINQLSPTNKTDNDVCIFLGLQPCRKICKNVIIFD